MTDIGFYHLTRSAVEQALPRLLARTLAAGQRALVLCHSTDDVVSLNNALWQGPQEDWLPHGSAADGDPDLQPIWLATEDSAPNGAKYLFRVNGAETTRSEAFERIFDLFDGNDETHVTAARKRWSTAKSTGHTLSYWQQGERGWERKA